MYARYGAAAAEYHADSPDATALNSVGLQLRIQCGTRLSNADILLKSIL